MKNDHQQDARVTTKRLFIKTYGCQMNFYDSDRMADLLAPLGYRLTDQVESADMVILNTCHIREKAAEKIFSELGRLRPHKLARRQEGGDVTIAVAGCVAQAEGAEILRRAPFVDLVVGPQTYHRLPELIAQAARARDAGGKGAPGRGIVATDFPPESKFDHLPQNGPRGVTAFLSIQEGCDKFCSFCVVPYTRGAEYSRPAADIIKEARQLVESGVREITLLGQNVNAYRGDAVPGIGRGDGTWGLADLLTALSEIDGLLRLRYTTSHPRDMDDALIAAHGSLEKLMPYLHLPVQSGSDRILAAMNRQHSADDYRRLIDRLRHAQPDLALSSDFIVGFPGESDKDFEASLTLIRDIGYAQAFSFKYSVRPGTPAASLPGQVPEAVKTERLMVLQDLLRAQQNQFNQAQLGRVLPVLFEKPGRHEGQMQGRSPYLQPVVVAGDASLVGSIHSVAITGVEPNSLQGDLLPDFPSDIFPSTSHEGEAA